MIFHSQIAAVSARLKVRRYGVIFYRVERPTEPKLVNYLLQSQSQNCDISKVITRLKQKIFYTIFFYIRARQKCLKSINKKFRRKYWDMFSLFIRLVNVCLKVLFDLIRPIKKSIKLKSFAYISFSTYWKTKKDIFKRSFNVCKNVLGHEKPINSICLNKFAF